jgi:hypothetical protein
MPKKSQSAIEYLTTYGWALIVIAIVLYLMYGFVTSTSGAVPTECTFTYGAYCYDVVIGSSSSSTYVAMLFSNTQQYPIAAPTLQMNLSNGMQIKAKCEPPLVLPGGAILCTATIPGQTLQLGQLVSGDVYLSDVLCPNANYAACSVLQGQKYKGTITVHASTLLTQVPVSITLSAKNLSDTADGAMDPLFAKVSIFGSPLPGATVNFSSNESFVALAPRTAATNSTGIALGNAWSNTTGKAMINATFANKTASIILNFTPPLILKFETSIMQSPTSQNVLTVDGIGYTYFQLPLIMRLAPGSSHTYSFASQVQTTTSNTRYAYKNITGCPSATSQNGIVIANASCTVLANYNAQYLLTMSSVPTNGGITTPAAATYWYNSGSQVTISEAPSVSSLPVYNFSEWIGSGANAYTGKGHTANVVMNGPITETAYFLGITLSPQSIVVVNGQKVHFTNYTYGGIGPYTYSYSVSPNVNFTEAGNNFTFSQQGGTYTVNITVTDGTGAKAFSSSIVSLGSFIYCIGGGGFYGYQGEGETSVVYSASIAGSTLNPWTQTTGYPMGIGYQGCTLYNGYIYCAGGVTPTLFQPGYYSITNATFSANVSGNTVSQWSQGPNYSPYQGMYNWLPIGCSAYSGYLYCMATYYTPGSSSSFGVPPYYAQSFSAPISGGHIGLMSKESNTTLWPTGYYSGVFDFPCVTYNGYMYCISGSDVSAPISNGHIGQWTITTPHIYGGRLEGAEGDACNEYKGYIYCIFSSNGYGQYSASASLSGGNIGPWSFYGYPIAVSTPPSCAIHNGYIYCVGGAPFQGISYGGPYNNVYSAPVSAGTIGTWTQEASYPTCGSYGCGIIAQSCVAP